ncbi:MAG: Tim44-like domain-containing protein [bacterium]|nr:Tim44-like domain-containing protein [bacterium]
MRSLFSCLLIALLSFGLVINEASAKRFGGGRSIGMQRSQSSLFSSNKTQNTAAMGQNSNKGRWGGMLGGMLIGGLLASLFMGNGLASGLMTWMMLGLALFVLVNFLRRKMQPSMQGASQPNMFRQNTFNQPFANTSSSSNFSGQSGFDSEAFLRNAKVSFIRLQAAYDQKNLQDLNTFTLPEVYAEIKMQLEERGDTLNKTEIITLNAELLDMSQQSGSNVASVRFTGSIKENDEPISPLDEIWHFRQFNTNKEWLVGGIQQDVYQP